MQTVPQLPAFDAIVLAGGSSRRMGRNKLGEPLGGLPLLDHAALAVSGSELTVVVGPQMDIVTDVQWVREDPPGSGPAMAIAAGVHALDDARTAADPVVILAGDMPFFHDNLAPLLTQVPDAGAAVLIDPSGQLQYLAAAWQRGALRDRVADIRPGDRVLELYRDVPVVLVPADRGAIDCDTPAELARARRLLRD